MGRKESNQTKTLIETIHLLENKGLDCRHALGDNINVQTMSYYVVFNKISDICEVTNHLLVNMWASSRENLSSGFPTKRVSNQSPQLQRLARKFKFHL